MKRFFTLALVGALALGVSSVANANFCAFDPAPAATLLFPFVAFDYNNPIDGAETLFGITNVSSEAQVVHVTLWSDYSTAVFDFNILLSGYDVVTLHIRDFLYFGTLPDTGTTGDYLVAANDDPFADGPVTAGDTGVYLDPSESTGTLDPSGTANDRCNPNFTAYPVYPPIPQPLLDQIRLVLQASQTSEREHGDCSLGISAPIVPDDWFQARTTADPTWMYITADVTWTCNQDLPDAAADYWRFNSADPLRFGFPGSAGGEKRVTNVLMGDIFWLNDAARFSEADNAVHIEADPFLGDVVTLTPTAPDYFPMSFYYRYSVATLGVAETDMREPLPTGWAFRYIGYMNNQYDTWIRAFKQGTNYFDDGTPPSTSWGQDDGPQVWDLWVDDNNLPTSMIACDQLAYTYFAWDEDEDVLTTSQDPWSCPPILPYCTPGFSPNLLPLETQEVNIDQFNLVDMSGWVMFLWPASNWDDGDDAWDHGDWYQTWMGVKYGAYGTYSAAMSAAVMANFNCFADQVYPGLGLGYFWLDESHDYPGAVDDGYTESTNIY
jgi:hypothetical protein